MSGVDNLNDPPPPYEYAVNDSGSRPNASAEPSRPNESQVYNHALRITANTSRGELAYPSDWGSRHDVSARDWDTFVARLFSGAAEGASEKRLSDERVQHIEGVISAWNRDFFQPRGVVIRWEGGPRTNHDSASSSATAPPNSGFRPQSHPSPHGHYQHPPSRPQPRPQPQPVPSSQLPSRSSQSTKHRLANKLRNAAKERDVSVSSSKIRVGDVFSLDATTGNLKIGKFSMTDKGMNYDGRPIGPHMPPHHGYAYNPAYGNGRGYPPPQGFRHGPGGPSSQYPGAGYGPPRHAGPWGSSGMPPRAGAYGPPQHSHTWDSPAQTPYGPPQGSYGYGPPQHRGSWSSYNTYQNSPFQGQPSSHEGQTSGTTG